MSIHGFCHHGKCKKPASVEVHAHKVDVTEEKDGVPLKVEQRKLHLCPEDAAYYLSVRDGGEGRKPNKGLADNFLNSCHKD